MYKLAEPEKGNIEVTFPLKLSLQSNYVFQIVLIVDKTCISYRITYSIL